MLVESQSGISNCHQIHGLQQNVLPAKREAIRAAALDVNRAHPLMIRDLFRHRGIADRMRLAWASRLEPVERDIRVVFILGDLDVVAVRAVYKLNFDRIEGIGTRLANYLYRIVAALAQKVAVAQIVDRRSVWNKDRAVGNRSCVSVTLQLHQTFRPDRRSV